MRKVPSHIICFRYMNKSAHKLRVNRVSILCSREAEGLDAS